MGLFAFLLLTIVLVRHRAAMSSLLERALVAKKSTPIMLYRRFAKSVAVSRFPLSFHVTNLIWSTNVKHIQACLIGKFGKDRKTPSNAEATEYLADVSALGIVLRAE